MRRDLVFNVATEREVRFRVTATAVRREVIVDAPVPDGGLSDEPGHVHRMRFTVAEAEAFSAALIEALAAARR